MLQTMYYLTPFRINATIDLEAESALQSARFADAGPANYRAERAAVDDWCKRNVQLSWHFIYNAMGKGFVGMSCGVPNDETVIRAFDIGALQRMVKLGYEIRRQRVGLDAISQFIQRHPEWSTHPASGRAFEWLADKHEIAMQPESTDMARNGFRFRIPVYVN
jgi:hypothetical protein